MLSAAILEDSVPMQNQLENYIRESFSGLTTEVFSSGEELLSYTEQNGASFSIYLMDISLPGMSGIETAAAIRKNNANALILYITDHREYVYEVFETLPFRFITKPVEQDVFLKAFSDALDYYTDQSRLFQFHIDREQYQIPLHEILYFESHLRKITLYTRDGAYTFYGRMHDLTGRLHPTLFVRTHASYIVNLDAVRVIRDAEVLLQSGILVPVSRSYRAEVRAKHLEYMKWRALK